ncbi:dynein regulatory complex protein 9-like isoform X3 [Portunus trituberculatus]|uniref:dynein regulatory complex protein 9-like isoform X3 n=1 Tax=Portunus trituberculatus TaxID=210409 RepID=UPI001E1CD7B7|nr:dynein regulatory complex protein 9-like isoform X3 [Portunus trituberculatus]XP_045121724.1 dynein regulatory complex protein 9-like isoform X3 [Portunus trituberculatus]
MAPAIPKDSQDPDLSRRRLAVMKVVDRLLEEGKDLASSLQDPRSPHAPPDYQAVNRVVEVLVSLRPTIHHRLYFSPTLQYLYASQLARRSGSAATSGQSVEEVERQLTEAQRGREAALSSREALTTSLSAKLASLDSQGSQAVLKCRREARRECEEVRGQSEASLNQLQAGLAASREAQQQQAERHSEDEALMRERRQQLEREMQQVIHKYDATMSCLQIDLDNLKDQHASLMLKLEHKTPGTEEKDKGLMIISLWQEALNIVEKRYRSILEEKQRAEEERLAAMQAEFRREHAARTIQRAWQHYKMRKMLKKAQRKRKKKPKDLKEAKK